MVSADVNKANLDLTYILETGKKIVSNATFLGGLTKCVFVLLFTVNENFIKRKGGKKKTLYRRQNFF